MDCNLPNFFVIDCGVLFFGDKRFSQSNPDKAGISLIFPSATVDSFYLHRIEAAVGEGRADTGQTGGILIIDSVQRPYVFQ